MRSGLINIYNTKLMGPSHAGRLWSSCAGMGTDSGYGASLNTNSVDSTYANNRYYAYSLRCLSTVLDR